MAVDHKTRKLHLTDLDALGQAAECLRVLAHPHRLRMIQMLLADQFTDNEFVIDSEHIIGPAVGETLRKPRLV